MTRTSVVLLDASGPESSGLVGAAVERGYEVHAVAHLSQTKADLPPGLASCHETDLTQADRARGDVVAIARHVGADALLSTNEYLTALVAEACAELGLPGNDPALAQAARNKAYMAQRFELSGVDAPRTQLVHTVEELEQLHAAGVVRFPCVIKPAEGAGSASVSIAGDEAAARRALQAALGQSGAFGRALHPQALVQELVEGLEYSVESISQGGVATHLCITKKLTTGPHCVEIGHELPVELPALAAQAVFRQVDLTLAAAGVRNGPSHTELILRSDGRCTVIEIGARVGAGLIGYLIEHALGIGIWSACLDASLGRPARLDRTRSRYAAVRFLCAPRPGCLTAVTGLPAESDDVPIVRMRRRIGDLVTEPRNNSTRLGAFIVAGDDQASVTEHASRVLSGIGIDVIPAGNSSAG